MFLFKKKPIVVDCFTYNAGIEEFFPISAASEYFPEWWKNLPKEVNATYTGIQHKMSSMKRCYGFIDLYKNSFIIPLWTDLLVESDETGNFNWSASANLAETCINTHDRSQYGPEFDNHIHMKINSPWLLTEKEGINFYFSPAFWNQIKFMNDLYITPGIVNYKHQATTHINCFIQKKHNKILLESGTPMIYLTPMTDRPVVLKTHVVSYEEYNNIFTKSQYSSSFVNKYKKNKNIKDSNESKCPFGFWK
jgi:hypothetical protein